MVVSIAYRLSGTVTRVLQSTARDLSLLSFALALNMAHSAPLENYRASESDPRVARVLERWDHDEHKDLGGVVVLRQGKLVAERYYKLEALHRVVEKRPLRAVHECVFGVLALESEPVDPRL
jgi:hypothetical protein